MAAKKKVTLRPVKKPLRREKGPGPKKTEQRSLSEVMADLSSLGTAQNVKIYARHGVSGAQFGVSFANLSKLQKQIKTDHELSRALWATKNFDAMNLATLICEPKRFSSSELDQMARDLENHAITDTFVRVVAHSPYAHKKAEAWRKKKNEWVARAGWMVVAAVAARGDKEDVAWLKSLLPEIKKNIHTSKNRVKDAINYALIAIGGYHDVLTGPALKVADAVGTVDVDHGETGCQTRPARPYIEAMVERRSRAEKKPVGRKTLKKR